MRRPQACQEVFCKFAHVRATSEREREKFPIFTFHVLENAQMTLSNVPKRAMLTGTARTSVGTRPRQKTRPPDSAYILCAVRHDEPRLPASLSLAVISVPMPVIEPACKRVLRTSKGNVAIQPIIPAAAPATSGAAHKGRARLCEIVSVPVSVSVSSSIGSGCAAKRRSVPSYYRIYLFFGMGHF